MPRSVRRVACAAHRAIGRWLPPHAFARRLPGIPGRVHVDDQMLRSESPEHVRHYLHDALSGRQNIEASLAVTGRVWSDVRGCLDLPSGYGRVTRHLAARLGAARVTAADVDRQAVRFCVAEFGVRGVVCPGDPQRMRLPDRYDLVFVGSLLTHLPIERGIALLRRLAGVVADGGLLIFSTQGASCLEHLDWYGPEFERAAGAMRAAVATSGAAFVPYRGRRDYGIVVHDEHWLRRTLSAWDGVRVVRFAPRGWHAPQDLWSLERV
jgi:SAM-dependent methyltransferase